jgi:type II secretory pathway component PulF
VPQFRYRARDKAGALIIGETEAKSEDELKESLSSEGMIPLSVKKKGGFSIDAIKSLFSRVKDEELMVFVRQFYTLFKAGISMNTIFTTLIKQSKDGTLRNALVRIRSDVTSGSTLAKAFGKHPKVFNELFVAMLMAGEEAGILEDVLKQLSTLLQKEFEIKKNIKSATLYPKIVVTVLVGVVIFMMMVIIPKFMAFYNYYDATLPLPTLMLISISNFFRNFWYIALVAFGVGILFSHRYLSTKTGRFKFDRMRLNLPVFGALNHKVANARFGHIMSSLYRSGLAMPRCLEVVANVIGNEAFARQVRQVRDDVQKGATLSEAMSRQVYFEIAMVETAAVGERSGSLDDMLSTVADHYDLEVSHTIKNLTTLLEPIMLVAIFGMVLLVALAIFLPIWNISSIVG